MEISDFVPEKYFQLVNLVRKILRKKLPKDDIEFQDHIEDLTENLEFSVSVGSVKNDKKEGKEEEEGERKEEGREEEAEYHLSDPKLPQESKKLYISLQEDQEIMKYISIALKHKDPFLLPNRIAYTAFSNGTPITSYGCILRYQEEKTAWYLIIQRRDSVEFNDLIRGSWSFSQLPLLLSNLTNEERNKILTMNHQELWKGLTGQETSGSSYVFSEEKYKLISEYLPDLLREIEWTPAAEQSMWMFPKGRAEFINQIQEEPLACAVREFNEEVGGCRPSLTALVPDRIYYEEYTGTNSKRYRTEYFLFLVEDADIHLEKEKINFETEKVKWICQKDLPIYLNKRRLALVNNIERDLVQNIAKKVPEDKMVEILKHIE